MISFQRRYSYTYVSKRYNARPTNGGSVQSGLQSLGTKPQQIHYFGVCYVQVSFSTSGVIQQHCYHRPRSDTTSNKSDLAQISWFIRLKVIIAGTCVPTVVEPTSLTRKANTCLNERLYKHKIKQIQAHNHVHP